MVPPISHGQQAIGSVVLRSFAQLAAGLVILAPLRPGKKFLICGGKVLGRGFKRGQSVVPALPDGGDTDASINSIAQNVSVQGAEHQFYAQLAPCVGDNG